jgi:hypothetical protein
MDDEISPALAEELRRLKEELPSAIKRAGDAARNNREQRGLGKPETFNFLSFVSDVLPPPFFVGRDGRV